MTTVQEHIRHARLWAGALWKDRPRYRRCLSLTGPAYLSLCNRGEQLERAPSGEGYRCLWQWTSDLTAPKALPELGKQLMRRSLNEHPIGRNTEGPDASAAPDVSFIIGHRGLARLPHLLATLDSIAAQQGAGIECIVVEQEAESRLGGRLPPWVRVIHTPPPDVDMAYCRSWAFNVGARHARGRLLILHDNDILVPQDYASSVLRHVAQGVELADIKRFVFYLGERHTAAVLHGRIALTDAAPGATTQNTTAGCSIAITREAYRRIGGMDESFIGWGGEDNEFWERAQTLKVWDYGYLPMVHLWHPAQPGKQQPDNPTLARYHALSAIPVQERIVRLLARPSGQLSGPAAMPAGAD